MVATLGQKRARWTFEQSDGPFSTVFMAALTLETERDDAGG